MKEILLPPRFARIPVRIILSALTLGLVGTFAAPGAGKPLFILVIALALCMTRGLFMLNPGGAAVLRWFGRYAGTIRAAEGPNGRWYWVNPLYGKRKIGLWGWFQSARLKVNDLEGNPIEIAANVSYTLEDTALALFTLQDVGEFIRNQSEAGLRSLAMRHPYDASPGSSRSLRADPGRAAQELCEELQSHLGGTGLRITGAQIVHLAYAPEIVALMLQRQQADATVAASRALVENAVMNVEAAVRLLPPGAGEAKAQRVHDLMISLCSHVPARPIVDASAAGSDL